MNTKVIVAEAKEVWLKVVKHKMKSEDKKIFIEALMLMIIYFLSFLVLSMGRVQQEFAGLSANSFSTIQLFLLTFILACALAYLIYFIVYKQVKTWK